MRKLFFPILFLLILFEIANVYFIMPMPGSQRWNVVGFSHFLYSWRWPLRMVMYLLLVLGIVPVFRKRKVWTILALLLAGFVTWLFNFRMTASNMFQPIKVKTMAGALNNKILPQKLVIGVDISGDARAYPIEMIGYHHRVLDTVGGKAIFVTYCTVCRTGRVYEPVVNGKQETFRLVGMDHFNAMFEDKTTGTWWRQATGEACAGKLKGQFLPAVPCVQMTLKEWLALHPNGKVLQWDTNFTEKYKRMQKFDKGTSGSKLTGTNRGSWQEKSWVLGVQGRSVSHVYDWRSVYKEKVIVDTMEGKELVLWISQNDMDYYAFVLPQKIPHLPANAGRRNGDTAYYGEYQFTPDGYMQKTGTSQRWKMESVQVYQEFWHSWRTFHPNTIRYPR